MKHEDAAYELFKDKYPEMALVIKKHGYRYIIDPELQPFGWEEKILTYADKRVAHDKIVTMKGRFKEGHQRYFTNNIDDGLSEEELSRIDLAFFELEKEIFDIIDIDPDKISEDI